MGDVAGTSCQATQYKANQTLNSMTVLPVDSAREVVSHIQAVGTSGQLGPADDCTAKHEINKRSLRAARQSDRLRASFCAICLRQSTQLLNITLYAWCGSRVSRQSAGCMRYLANYSGRWDNVLVQARSLIQTHLMFAHHGAYPVLPLPAACGVRNTSSRSTLLPPQPSSRHKTDPTLPLQDDAGAHGFTTSTVEGTFAPGRQGTGSDPVC
jgi:hypothetical protein